MLKNRVLTIIILVFLVPQVAFASWWNPFSWFKKKPEVTNNVVQQVNTSSTNISTTTTSLGDSESDSPKKDAVEPKKSQKETKSTKTTIHEPLTVFTTPPLSKTKTCLDNSVVSADEYCKKVCPDGEIITENLTCRTIVVQPVDVCKNIEGIQTVIPTDMVLNSLGNCFTSTNVQQEPVLNKIVVGVQGSFMEGATTTIIVYIYPAGMKSRDILNVKFHDASGDTVIPATEVGYDTENRFYFAKLIFKYLWAPSKGNTLQVNVDGVGSKTINTLTGEVK